MAHRTRRLPASIRARVLARDGWRCTVAPYDDRPCSDRLDVHHVEPVALGGPDVDDNLYTACSRHHAVWEHLSRSLRETGGDAAGDPWGKIAATPPATDARITRRAA